MQNKQSNLRPLTKIDVDNVVYMLPSPLYNSKTSVEQALSQRRSHRFYQDRAITAEDLSQVLWAAYGITMPRDDYDFLRGGLHTAPSAGALYPLDIYVIVGKVKDIDPGVYKYIPDGHKIVQTKENDNRTELCKAALDQEMIKEAPVVLVYTATFSRNTEKYGERGRERYVCMDLGHSAQNVYLQVESLNMGTCAIGTFEDDKVVEVMGLIPGEEPLYIMPFGYYDDKPEF